MEKKHSHSQEILSANDNNDNNDNGGINISTTTKPKNRGIYILPNLFTIGALFAGFYAIVAALKGNHDIAAMSIFVSILMDGLDGRVARLTNTVTAFGAELDSMSDMVCFGIAPALVIYSWSLFTLGKPGWLAAFIYVAATALRLARFNTQLGKDDKNYFQGLSSTMAAAVIASIVWLGRDLEIPPHNFSILLAILTTIAGVLMVSNIRYRSFKEANLKNHVPFIVILALVVAVVLISIDPAKVLFAICMLYACSGPVATIWGLRRKKKQRKGNKGHNN
jgi:CDP-diacylglycerol---serine O-phosphatidyltransferase